MSTATLERPQATIEERYRAAVIEFGKKDPRAGKWVTSPNAAGESVARWVPDEQPPADIFDGVRFFPQDFSEDVGTYRSRVNALVVLRGEDGETGKLRERIADLEKQLAELPTCQTPNKGFRTLGELLAALHEAKDGHRRQSIQLQIRKTRSDLERHQRSARSVLAATSDPWLTEQEAKLVQDIQTLQGQIKLRSGSDKLQGRARLLQEALDEIVKQNKWPRQWQALELPAPQAHPNALVRLRGEVERQLLAVRERLGALDTEQVRAANEKNRAEIVQLQGRIEELRRQRFLPECMRFHRDPGPKDAPLTPMPSG